MKDFYYILGTEENATSLEIKEAYRKLSKKFHPDVNFNDKYFEKHFREIKEHTKRSSILISEPYTIKNYANSS